jgi:hypothetical protein
MSFLESTKNCKTVSYVLQSMAQMFDDSDDNDFEYVGLSNSEILEELQNREYRIIKTNQQITEDDVFWFIKNYENYVLNTIQDIYEDYKKIDSSILRDDIHLDTYVKFYTDTSQTILDTKYVYSLDKVYVFNSLADIVKYLDGDCEVVAYKGNNANFETFTLEEFYS